MRFKRGDRVCGKGELLLPDGCGPYAVVLSVQRYGISGWCLEIRRPVGGVYAEPRNILVVAADCALATGYGASAATLAKRATYRNKKGRRAMRLAAQEAVRRMRA